MKTLMWLRRDLRLQDNLALTAAVASGQPLEAVFVYPLEQKSPLAEGAAARWYLHHSLLNLQQRLFCMGIRLHVLQGAAKQVLPVFCEEHSVSRIYWNRLLDPEVEKIDKQVRQSVSAVDVTCNCFSDDCLLLPDEALKNDGSAYQVFTPFWRNLQNIIGINRLSHRLTPVPESIGSTVVSDKASLDALGLLTAHPWHEKLHAEWTPGEPTALRLLDEFLEYRVQDYDKQRDLPAQHGTSRLSAALHFGELSVANVYVEAAQRLLHEPEEAARLSIKRYLTEIGWREFARHVLHAFPHTAERSKNPLFDQAAAWEPDPDNEKLHRWQQGETGIALVDAGMRELWQTGWMHNRVRMVAASFLTKNIGIHWREGAKWFADTLVDADRASNTLGWQWIAGCGTDAAPYYRIFNANTQARKFDPMSDYINRWLGSTERVKPVTDLKLSRAHALERYRRAVKQTAA